MKKCKTLLLVLFIGIGWFSEIGSQTLSSIDPKIQFRKVNRINGEKKKISEIKPFLKGIETREKLKDNMTTFLSQKILSTKSNIENRLYGSLLNTDAPWGDYYNLGIYSFLADGSPIEQIQREKPIPGLTTFSGVLVDGKYYAFTVLLGFPTYYLDVYDATSWEYLYSFYLGGVRHVPNDLAYDPTEEKGYGTVCDYDGTGKFTILERFDLKKGECEFVGNTKEGNTVVNILVMSSTVKGELYGISSEGILYKINKQTAALERVGSTGIPKVSSFQGSTIDNKDNFYWASYDTLSAKSALYKVDLSNAHVNKISNFPYNEQITGMYNLSPLALPEAPDKVQNLRFNALPGELTGTISLMAPNTTIEGTALSEPMNITISLYWDVNTEETIVVRDSTFMIQLSPNQSYESKLINLTQSSYIISAVATTNIGKGINSIIEFWAGKDIPAEIKDLKLERDEDGNGKLTWTPPTQGYHGGYFDPSSVTYDIIRLPDSILVGNKYASNEGIFIDKTIPAVGIYRYELTPYSNGGEGLTVKSSEIGLGKASNVPYLEEFNSEAAFNLWTIVDQNQGYGKYDVSWGYADGRIVYAYDPDVAADDWLMSPPVFLKAGAVYQLKFDAWADMANYPESIKITIGSSLNPTSHTITVKDLPELKNTVPQKYDGAFSVQSDGLYYIGVYCYSKANQARVYVDNISLYLVSGIATPGSVTDLVAIAGEKGSREVTLSFTASSKTGSNEDLDEISKIEIFRNDSPTSTYTISPVVKGQKYTWTDNNPIETVSNKYKVIASNSHGKGYPAETSVYVGIDIPIQVKELYLMNANGNAVITWDAPTEGVHGGYIDVEALRYTVTRSDGEVLNSQVKELSYTDETVTKTTQKFIYYTVKARSESGLGEGTNTNGIVFGQPYTLPYNESFAGTTLYTTPWTISGLTSVGFDWKIVSEAKNPTATPQDHDGGLAQFSSYSIPTGDEAILVSPQISITNEIDPELSFWFFHYIENNETHQDALQPMISANDAEFVALSNPIMRIHNNNGWTNYRYGLNDYLYADRIRIGFKGISDYGYNLLIDNISVEGSSYPKVTDLSATANENSVILTWSAPINNTGEPLNLIGYNVYRDLHKINSSLVTDLRYVDSVEDGYYTYQVTAVYDSGESGYSNAVTITKGTGISTIKQSDRIYAINNTIIIEGTINNPITVCSADGIIIYSGKIEQAFTLLPIKNPGIYLVNINGHITKVMIK